MEKIFLTINILPPPQKKKISACACMCVGKWVNGDNFHIHTLLTNLFVKIRQKKALPIISCDNFVLEVLNMCTKILVEHLYNTTMRTHLYLQRYLGLPPSIPDNKGVQIPFHMELKKKHHQDQHPSNLVQVQSVDYHCQTSQPMKHYHYHQALCKNTHTESCNVFQPPTSQYIYTHLMTSNKQVQKNIPMA